jgi:hypothetical protein
MALLTTDLANAYSYALNNKKKFSYDKLETTNILKEILLFKGLKLLVHGHSLVIIEDSNSNNKSERKINHVDQEHSLTSTSNFFFTLSLLAFHMFNHLG